MFQLLEPTTVKLKKAGTHVENHGDEERIALDLRVIWTTNNRNLDLIQPGLREAFFCNIGAERAAENGELDLPVDELPNVRFPGMEYPIKLSYQQVGAKVAVAHGIDETSAIVMQLCKTHKYEFTPIEGGSAKIEYSISTSADVDGDMIGTTSLMQKHEISIVQTMPEVEQPTPPLTPEDVFGEQEPDAPPLTVEDVFVNESKPAAEKGRKGKKASA